MYILGQVLGGCSTVCTIILPFFKKKWQILVLNIAVNLLIASNLALIGQIGSGVFLCLVAVVQSIVSMNHDLKGTPILFWEKILFLVLYVGFGFFGIVTAPDFVPTINAKNLLELMPIVGALMLMFSVFSKTEQTMRKFLLINATIWTIYTAIVGSTAFFTDLFCMCSTAAALFKYRNKVQEANEA